MSSVVGRVVVSLVVGICALLLVSSAPHSGRVARWFGVGAQPSLRFAVTVPAEVDDRGVDELEAAWRSRVGTHELRVERRGPGDLELEVIGADAGEAEAIEWALIAQGRLELRPVAEDTPLARALFRAVRSGEWPAIQGDLDGWRHDVTGRSYDDYYLYGPSVEALEAAIAEIGRRDPEARPGQGQTIAFEWVFPALDAGEAAPFVRTYVLEGPPVLDDSHVATAMTIWDPQTNRPEVLVELDAEGTQRFGDFTAGHVGRKVAILVDGEVVSAPVIQSAITGGRANVSMSGGTLDEQQAEADGLVAALQSRTVLPAGLTARLTGATQPSSAIRWGIRIGVAAAAALLAWLLAWLIARRTSLTPVLGGVTSPRVEAVAAPAAITAGLLVTVVLLERISLPWLADWLRDASTSRAELSAVALGIGPVLSAFFLVEVIALAIPGWRRRRRGTVVDRAPIDRAVAWLTVGLSVLQAWFFASFLQGMEADQQGLSGGLRERVVVTATLVGGVMLLAIIAGAISRAGLINGWLALFALASARILIETVRADSPSSDSDLGMIHAAIAGLAAVIAVALVVRRAAAPDRRRLPLAGLAPLLVAPMAVGVLAIPYLATLPGVAGAARWLSVRSPWLDLAVAIAVAIAWSWPRPDRVGSRLAMASSVAAVGAIGLLPMLLPGEWRLWSHVVPAAVAAVALVELSAGVLRTIRMPDAAVLISVHDVERADAIRDDLHAAGIPVAQGGVLARALLRFFGPYVPVVIHVPARRLDEAIAVVGAAR